LEVEEDEDEEEEEEKEEEGAYGSVSPNPWVDLADKEEPTGDDASLGGPFPFYIGEDAPLEPTEVDHPIPSKLSKQREGSKWPRADEV
jgi:hypothetical protein